MSIRYKFVGKITSQGSLRYSSKVCKISTDVLVLLYGSRTGALVLLLSSGCERLSIAGIDNGRCFILFFVFGVDGV